MLPKWSIGKINWAGRFHYWPCQPITPYRQIPLIKVLPIERNFQVIFQNGYWIFQKRWRRPPTFFYCRYITYCFINIAVKRIYWSVPQFHLETIRPLRTL